MCLMWVHSATNLGRAQLSFAADSPFFEEPVNQPLNTIEQHPETGKERYATKKTAEPIKLLCNPSEEERTDAGKRPHP